MQESQAAIAQKQDDLDDAVEVATFLLRQERREPSAEERRRLGQSLEAISGLLIERENELLRELAQLPPQDILSVAEQLPQETVGLAVSNSAECLQLALLHGSSRRMPYHRVFQHRG